VRGGDVDDLAHAAVENHNPFHLVHEGFLEGHEELLQWLHIQLRRADEDEALHLLAVPRQDLFDLLQLRGLAHHRIEPFPDTPEGQAGVRENLVYGGDVDRWFRRSCKKLNGEENTAHEILREISPKEHHCCLF
jgi:hypothetical protein